ncbi:MAG: YitT family protein [Acidobacteriota bacterium]|nr:YitT family protein [Acidobacteriota bacterium]
MTTRASLRELKNAVLIAIGIASAALGLKGFLLAGHLIDGGVTGVSMLLDRVTALPLEVWLPLVNLPFVAVAYRVIGTAFAVRSAIAISVLALTLAFGHFPEVTADRLLEAVFGGFFLGGGIGLAMRGGAVLDGTEIAALLISRRSHVLKVGDVILMFNVALFLAAMSVLGVEASLYSILTYFTAAKTLDFVIHGIEEYTAMTIVSGASDAIRAGITTSLGRGVTVYRGYGGMSGSEQHILFCVVTRLEIGKVKTIVKGIDEGAFIVSHALSDVEGGVVKRAKLQ